MKTQALLCITSLIFICCCGSSLELSKASGVIDSYYRSMRENRAADASRFFSEDFARRNPPESWNETVSEIRSIMGPLVDWQKLSDKAHYYFSATGKQETVVLVYTARYERHYAKEQFILVKDVKTGDYRICGMDITAKGMPEEKTK